MGFKRRIPNVIFSEMLALFGIQQLMNLNFMVLNINSKGQGIIVPTTQKFNKKNL